VAVVGLLALGVLVVRTSHRGPTQASLEQATSDVNLRLSDIPQPQGWTPVGHSTATRHQLTAVGACPSPLQTANLAGTENDFSFDLNPSGSEAGHLAATVVVTTTEQANQKLRALADGPAYLLCVTRDVEASMRASGGGLQVFSSTISELGRHLPLPGRALQVATIYQFGGIDRTMYTDVIKMYAGRLRITLWFNRCCQAFDPQFEEAVLNRIAPRMTAEARRLRD